MKSIIATISILILSFASVLGQIDATTKDGKKVILKNDGTWQYVQLDPKGLYAGSNLDCESLVSVETDKMTGETFFGSKKSLVISDDNGSNGFAIYLLKASRSLIFVSNVSGAGNCIDEKNKMNILFRDGNRVELQNNGDFNCKGKFTVYFGGAFGNQKALDMLKTKEIETMRIWTSSGFVEKDFSQLQSKELMATINCLLDK